MSPTGQRRPADKPDSAGPDSGLPDREDMDALSTELLQRVQSGEEKALCQTVKHTLRSFGPVVCVVLVA